MDPDEFEKAKAEAGQALVQLKAKLALIDQRIAAEDTLAEHWQHLKETGGGWGAEVEALAEAWQTVMDFNAFDRTPEPSHEEDLGRPGTGV